MQRPQSPVSKCYSGADDDIPHGKGSLAFDIVPGSSWAFCAWTTITVGRSLKRSLPQPQSRPLKTLKTRSTFLPPSWHPLSTQVWRHFLTWSLVLLIAVTNEQYWCTYYRFGWFFCRFVRAKEGTWQMAAGARAAIGDSTYGKIKRVLMVTSPVPSCTSRQRFHARLISKLKSSYNTEGSRGLERQCTRPGTLCSFESYLAMPKSVR